MDDIFSYGSEMYRKHPNHTYRRNQNNSPNNWANVIEMTNTKDLSFYSAEPCSSCVHDSIKRLFWAGKPGYSSKF